MVGSIFQTYEANSQIEKGQEKGYFAFGGSTLVMMFEKGKVEVSIETIFKGTLCLDPSDRDSHFQL